MTSDTRDLTGLIEALGIQRQCDEDGVLIAVSRQAVDEAREALRELAAANARIAELEGANNVLKRQHDFQFDKCKRAESALAECIKLSDAMENWTTYEEWGRAANKYRQWRAKQ